MTWSMFSQKTKQKKGRHSNSARLFFGVEGVERFIQSKICH